MSDSDKARRARSRARRHREGSGANKVRFGPATGRGVGWDHDATPEAVEEERPAAPLTARVLSVFSEPGVYAVSVDQAAKAAGAPRADVENALDALVQAGELRHDHEVDHYAIDPRRKQRLELLYREAAHELGETTALARRDPGDLAVFDDDDEPRLPVTAGLLSLFLPGTGQLLNGDVGRASLVFAVWSLALLTHLSPIWTFVALYAGAEAFFTAKIRGIERKLELEAGTTPEPKALT